MNPAKSPQHERLGQLIRSARTARGYSGTTLADLCGVERQAVSNWETGKNWPAALQRDRLQQVLGLEIPEEPEPMALPPKAPASHAPGIRYAAQRMQAMAAQLFQFADEIESATAPDIHALAAAERERDARLRAERAAPPRKSKRG